MGNPRLTRCCKRLRRWRLVGLNYDSDRKRGHSDRVCGILQGEGNGKRERQRKSTEPRGLTAPCVVIHEEDPVEDDSELRGIGDRSAVWTDEGRCLCCGGDAGSRREEGTKEGEEGKEIGGIVWGEMVAIEAWLAGILPVDVDAIDAKLVVESQDVLGKGLPGLGRCNSWGEVPEAEVDFELDMVSSWRVD